MVDKWSARQAGKTAVFGGSHQNPFPYVLFLFYRSFMPRFATLSPEHALAAAIDAAPGWAKFALSMRDPSMRERGATEIAGSIVSTLTSPCDDNPRAQLPLF